MERNITIHKIKKRIDDAKKGKIFMLSDFLDLASYDAVKKTLSRLSKKNELVRIKRGIYYKPNYNEFLQKEVLPSVDDLAKAIAQEHNWTIGPKGDAALNILCLTTQVPAVYNYISDGPTKTIDYGGFQIIFEKITNKNISGKSYKTILIIEAIRSIGRNNMTNEIRSRIANQSSSNDLKLLLQDGIRAQRWVYEEIKKIITIGGEENDKFNEAIR